MTHATATRISLQLGGVVVYGALSAHKPYQIQLGPARGAGTQPVGRLPLGKGPPWAGGSTAAHFGTSTRYVQGTYVVTRNTEFGHLRMRRRQARTAGLGTSGPPDQRLSGAGAPRPSQFGTRSHPAVGHDVLTRKPEDGIQPVPVRKARTAGLGPNLHYGRGGTAHKCDCGSRVRDQSLWADGRHLGLR